MFFEDLSIGEGTIVTMVRNDGTFGSLDRQGSNFKSILVKPGGVGKS